MLRVSLLYELVVLVSYAICCFDLFMWVEFDVSKQTRLFDRSAIFSWWRRTSHGSGDSSCSSPWISWVAGTTLRQIFLLFFFHFLVCIMCLIVFFLCSILTRRFSRYISMYLCLRCMHHLKHILCQSRNQIVSVLGGSEILPQFDV